MWACYAKSTNLAGWWLSRFTQLISQPPDIRLCNNHRQVKHQQVQFSRQIFAANQTSAGRSQVDFFSPTDAPNFSGVDLNMEISVLGYASFNCCDFNACLRPAQAAVRRSESFAPNYMLSPEHQSDRVSSKLAKSLRQSGQLRRNFWSNWVGFLHLMTAQLEDSDIDQIIITHTINGMSK